MYNVTENYKTSMAETVRNPSYLKITFGIISQTGAESSVISANSNDIYSTPNNIDISTNVVDKIYAKLLPNNCVLDGNTVMLPESNFAYQGYSSVYYMCNCIQNLQFIRTRENIFTKLLSINLPDIIQKRRSEMLQHLPIHATALLHL